VPQYSQQHKGFHFLIDHLLKQRPLKLLDIGCSLCIEGEALQNAGIEFTGIDQDEAAIETVRSRFPDKTFISMDASRYNPDQKTLYEVLLFRRPDLSVQHDHWQRILKRSTKWLTAEGRVYITTTGEIEAEIAKVMLTHAGYMEITTMYTGLEEESFMMTAILDKQKIEEDDIPQLPKGVILWEDEPAPMCDITTGFCD